MYLRRQKRRRIGRACLRCLPINLKNHSPQETEVVPVLLRLADKKPADLLRGADPSAVLRDYLRVQRDSLAKSRVVDERTRDAVGTDKTSCGTREASSFGYVISTAAVYGVSNDSDLWLYSLSSTPDAGRSTVPRMTAQRRYTAFRKGVDNLLYLPRAWCVHVLLPAASRTALKLSLDLTTITLSAPTRPLAAKPSIIIDESVKSEALVTCRYVQHAGCGCSQRTRRRKTSALVRGQFFKPSDDAPPMYCCCS